MRIGRLLGLDETEERETVMLLQIKSDIIELALMSVD